VRQGWHVLHPGQPLEWNWHLEAVCLHLQLCYLDLLRARRDRSFAQPLQNLLFNVPPRSGKSMIVNVYFPAWAWLHDPTIEFLCLSFNPDVAGRDARFWRDLVFSRWYHEQRAHAVAHAGLVNWTVGNVTALRSVVNSARGSRRAKGLNAMVMGENSDVLIIDDPHDPRAKNMENAMAATNRRYSDTVHNRMNDFQRCMRVGIMQRLHYEDWSAHVLASGIWEHVMIPMEFDPSRARVTAYGWSDPRTQEGELLHPARFPAEWCESEKQPGRLGAYGWAGQMQQTPSPAGGGMFPRAAWRFWKPDGRKEFDGTPLPRPHGCYDGPAYPLPERFDMVVLSLDASFKAHKESDWNVFTVWGVKGADMFLLERVRGHFIAPQTVEQFRAIETRMAARGIRITHRLVEGKANGNAVMQYLEHEVPGIIEINPKDSKESRASGVQALVLGANVYLPDGAPWLGEWVEEFATFPVGSHDDQVDSFTQAANWLQANRSTSLAALARVNMSAFKRALT